MAGTAVPRWGEQEHGEAVGINGAGQPVDAHGNVIPAEPAPAPAVGHPDLPPPRVPTPPTAVGTPRGHVAGTPLDEHHVAQAPMPTAKVGLLMFLVAFAAYSAIGYWFTIDLHVVVFDALDRMTRGLLIWHNDPPKLAAIGFLFPPLTTLVFLPFTVIKPLASGLIAIPLTSAFFAAGTIVFIDRTMARCDLHFILRIPLLLAFALNPFWVFYAGNGMSEAVYSMMLAFVMYSFVSWYVSTEPRYLIASGFGLSFLILTRYAFIIWAVLLALLIGVALVRRRASRIEVEGSIVAFAAPVMYAIALWILFNALIVGDPFGWINTATSTQAVNSTGIGETSSLSFDLVSQRLLQLNVGIFPLAFAAVPALVATFMAQRNDMALWLASFIVLGIVIIGAHAYIAQEEGLLTLRDSMPMYVASLFGAIWVYRSFEAFRPIIWGVTLALMLLNFVTAWHAMKTYKFQSQEQAFTRAISTQKSQEGTSSKGGYTVGIQSESQMAQYVKDHVKGKNAILTDNAQTFGVIALSGRPQVFFDRIDKGDAIWNTVLNAPRGKVQYMLLTRNLRSGDQITLRYRQADAGQVPGLTPVFRTARYTLVKVAPATRRGATNATAGSDQGTTGTSGSNSTSTQPAATTPTATTGGAVGGVSTP